MIPPLRSAERLLATVEKWGTYHSSERALVTELRESGAWHLVGFAQVAATAYRLRVDSLETGTRLLLEFDESTTEARVLLLNCSSCSKELEGPTLPACAVCLACIGEANPEALRPRSREVARVVGILGAFVLATLLAVPSFGAESPEVAKREARARVFTRATGTRWAPQIRGRLEKPWDTSRRRIGAGVPHGLQNRLGASCRGRMVRLHPSSANFRR